MKNLLLLVFGVITYSLSFSQILDPVEWTFSTRDLGNNEHELIFTALIDNGWSIYGKDIEEGGPVATSFSFTESADYELIGSTEESDVNKKTGEDPIFDNIIVSKFHDKAVFTQRIKLTQPLTTINGSLVYMTCDDNRCLPPTDEPFSFSFSEEGVTTGNNTEELSTELIDQSKANELLYGMSPVDLNLETTPCSEKITARTDGGDKEDKSLWNIFGLGFLGGLLALLTPCVFPMIPLTVSFFTKKGTDAKKQSGIGKAILYGFFILAVYLILSIPFHLLDTINPDILNDISTNVWLNVFFFLIFVFFAFSFFGYYELTLPASWTSKTTQGENFGGILGVFFMALTLAIVSFSCTGPILGSLLAGSLSSDGGAWQLTAGMGGFGLALGLPFALFAMFPNMLNSLPKSGGWLNTVKVVLGFLELALAFKFLSNADLVKHWGILKIEPFLIIWILLFGGLALYLFGKIKFPHDSPLKKLSVFRMAFGVLIAAFTLYLISGFRTNEATGTYKPLKLLSGLAPPVGYSFFKPNDCPNNLECYKDLKEGINAATKQNKPIILDFTGYACVNCRKMEEHVWTNSEIDQLLRNEFVLISLYVDDKKPLPKDQQIEVERVNGGIRTLKDYGDKWAHFQTQFFQTNSQPHYVLLSPDGKQLLNQPVGYTPDAKEYGKFLRCGIEKLMNN